MTLIFLGDVEVARVAHAQAAMQAAAGAGFTLTFDVVEYRRNGGILWARATQTPDGLAMLVLELRAALRARGFAVEERAFVPHVTLLRDAGKPAFINALAPLRWRVSETALARSELSPAGARYEIMSRVPLSGR